MSHSQELGVPFVDAEAAAFARSCRDRHKVEAKGGGAPCDEIGAKRVLIEALRDLLPPGIESRPKQRLSVPWEQWMRGPLHEVALDTTSEATARRRGLLPPHAVASVRGGVERRARGSNHPKLLPLMVLELWCREVLESAMGGGEEVKRDA